MSQISVFIIESQRPDDLYDGRAEGRVLYEMLLLAEIHVTYRIAVNREQFRRALAELGEYISARTSGVLPFLHVSAHGNKQCIVLTDGEEINWRDLRNELMPIRGPFGMLLVCLSSCEGFEAWQAAEGSDVSPFFALVALRESVSWDASAIAFMTFYHLCAKSDGTQTLKSIVEIMRAASGEDSFDIIGATRVNKAYLQKL